MPSSKYRNCYIHQEKAHACALLRKGPSLRLRELLSIKFTITTRSRAKSSFQFLQCALKPEYNKEHNIRLNSVSLHEYPWFAQLKLTGAVKRIRDEGCCSRKSRPLLIFMRHSRAQKSSTSTQGGLGKSMMSDTPQYKSLHTFALIVEIIDLDELEVTFQPEKTTQTGKPFTTNKMKKSVAKITLKVTVHRCVAIQAQQSLQRRHVP